MQTTTEPPPTIGATVRIDFETAPLGHAVGARRDDGVVTDGRAGALVYGPYWRLAPGRYRLRAVFDGPVRGHGLLHAWHGQSAHRIASTALLPESATEIAFTLDEEVPDAEFVLQVEAGTVARFLHFELGGQVAHRGVTGGAVMRRDFGDNLPFRHVLGLGTHCFTASFLHRQGWRRFSGPFDWIFSNPDLVVHCIEDGFETLLDRSHYQPVPVEERPDPQAYRCHHRGYRERFGIPYLFNHHDVWTDEGHAYVRRCVERFLRVARGGAPALMLQCGDETEHSVRGFRAVADCVGRHFPACTLNAFVVSRATVPGVVPEIGLMDARGPHRLFHIRSVDGWEPVSFRNPIDEMAMASVLRLHRLNLA